MWLCFEIFLSLVKLINIINNSFLTAVYLYFICLINYKFLSNFHVYIQVSKIFSFCFTLQGFHVSLQFTFQKMVRCETTWQHAAQLGTAEPRAKSKDFKQQIKEEHPAHKKVWQQL